MELFEPVDAGGTGADLGQECASDAAPAHLRCDVHPEDVGPVAHLYADAADHGDDPDERVVEGAKREGAIGAVLATEALPRLVKAACYGLAVGLAEAFRVL